MVTPAEAAAGIRRQQFDLSPLSLGAGAGQQRCAGADATAGPMSIPIPKHRKEPSARAKPTTAPTVRFVIPDSIPGIHPPHQGASSVIKHPPPG